MLTSTLRNLSSLLFCLLFANSAWAYDYIIGSSFSNWTAMGGYQTCYGYGGNKACISDGTYEGVDSGNLVFAYRNDPISSIIILDSTVQNSSSTYYLSLDAMVGPRNDEQNTKYEVLAITVYLKDDFGYTIATISESQTITNTTMDTYVLNLGSFSGVYSMVVYISGRDGGYWAGNYGAVLGAGSVLLSDYDPTQAVAPPPTTTPVYSSGITSTQSTKRTSKLSDTASHGMEAHVDIDGNSNDVTIKQVGDAHYLELGVVGNTNIVNIEQTTVSGGTHYLEAKINGSGNNLDVLQSDTSKTAFIDIDGDSNTADVIQKGTGQHYLQLDMIGDGHNATVIQEGNGSHEATVELTNGGGAWDFTLNQQGTTSKEYSLPHSMSDGSTTSGTCYVAAGCSLTVTQQD